jgi:endonuclease-3
MNQIQRVLERLQKVTACVPPVASQLLVQKFGRDPFLVLIFCLLSLRTKDPVAFAAACRLFEVAKDPAVLSALDYEIIQKLIFPVGFYRKKARTLIAVSQIISKKYAGIVPSTYSGLIALPGVGPKTAHLVLAEGFGIPAICVDTHVHRLSNRLGLVATKTVEQTQIELEKIISKDQWISINRVLVAWGQTICKPVSPLCSQCPLQDICPRNGVIKSR